MPIPWKCSPPAPDHGQICVVHGDESVADSLESRLESFGYSVQSYISGADFLADDRRCATGCLIIDQHMPGLQGLDVVARLQKRRSLATDYPYFRPARRKREKPRLAPRVVDKPFAAARFVDLIRAALLERD